MGLGDGSSFLEEVMIYKGGPDGQQVAERGSSS